MRTRRRAFGAAAVIVITLASSACRRDEPGPAGTPAAATLPADSLQSEADMLGREVHQIMDRVVAYRTSHYGLMPGSLRQVGLDSLTPMFERQVDHQDKVPIVTIAFRKLGDRQVASCSGTSQALEDASIEGEFEVTCRLVDGSTRTFHVETEPPAPAPPR